MKVCIEAHDAPGFGHVPAGSLWDDDSPYAQGEQFAPVDETPTPKPAKKPATRKFGAKEAASGDPVMD